MLEWLAPGFLHNAGKDLLRFLRPKKLTPEQVVERLAAAVRAGFRQELWTV